MLAVALLSPKDQATPTNAPMAKDSMIPPDALVDTNPPAPSVLGLAWNQSVSASGYSLSQWAAGGSGGTNIWNTPFTNVTISYDWGDEPLRFKYAVLATNAIGRSVMSTVLMWPALPPTKIILNWRGSQRIQQSTDCKTWTLFTNGLGPVTLPMLGAQRFFMGTNIVILGGSYSTTAP